MNKMEINSFIEKLDLPQYIANVLFETSDDYTLFLSDYHKKNAFVIDDLLDFREYKIAQSSITKEIFLKLCKSGDFGGVFEKTFYQSFNENDIEVVQSAINANRISLEQLFDNFTKNPDKNIMKYVL